MSTVKLDTRKIVFTIIWCLVGIAIMVLLVAAVRSKDVKLCKGVSIEIIDVSNNFFIDKEDVLGIIKNYVGGVPEGRYIKQFNLGAIEAHLEKDVWIKDAELFFDNNELLRVSVYEREPVSRVFATDGSSFYLDTSLKVLPLSEKFSARLPVFTGFSHNGGLISKADSNTFKAINKISVALQTDSFLMAMIEQVDITPQQTFEMIPKIGNQVIVLGQAQDIDQKLSKLKIFYKEVITKVGWSKYSVINLQYKNQVVAKIKDAADKTSDSLRALQIMQLIAERSARQAADSALLFAHQNERNLVDSSMIQQSVQREDEGFSEVPVQLNEPARDTVLKASSVVSKPAAKAEPAKPVTPKSATATPAAIKPAVKPTAKKPAVTTKPAGAKQPAPKQTPTQKPKAVMQKPGTR